MSPPARPLSTDPAADEGRVYHPRDFFSVAPEPQGGWEWHVMAVRPLGGDKNVPAATPEPSGNCQAARGRPQPKAFAAGLLADAGRSVGVGDARDVGCESRSRARSR